jgi:hypothetical protein
MNYNKKHENDHMADFLGTTTMAALQSGYWLKYIVIYMIQCMVRRKTISLFSWGTFYFKDNNIGRHFKVDIFTGMSVPMYVCSKPKGVNFAYFYNFSEQNVL